MHSKNKIKSRNCIIITNDWLPVTTSKQLLYSIGKHIFGTALSDAFTTFRLYFLILRMNTSPVCPFGEGRRRRGLPVGYRCEAG